jgi:hypothetical protein
MRRQGWWFLVGALALGVLIDTGILAALACNAPAWRTLLNDAPSCAEFWLNRYQGLIGALATLTAGFLAYRAAVSEARRAERQARDVRSSALRDKIRRLCADIDALKVAAGYLGTYAGRFPPAENPDQDSYFQAFQNAWVTADDSTSYSALDAPDSYGNRINTLMTTIQQLGERINEVSSRMGSNRAALLNTFGKTIIDKVNGLRMVEKQMRSKIPDYEAQLNAARDELSALENGNR